MALEARCFGLLLVLWLASFPVQAAPVLPCSKVPAAWALLPLPDNRAEDFARALANITGRNWREEGQELLRLNGQRLLRMQPFRYIRVSGMVANSLRTKYQQVITTNNARPDCRPPTRPARVVVAHRDTTLGRLFGQLGIRSATAFSVVAREAELFNPELSFDDPTTRVAKGAMFLLPQSFPFPPRLLEELPRLDQPQQQQEDVSSDPPPARGGFTFSLFGGYKRDVLRGLDTESDGAARGVSEGSLSVMLSAGYDADFGPGMLLAKVGITRDSYSFNQVSANGSVIDQSEVPSDASLASLEFGWGAEDQQIYLGVEASQKSLIIIQRDENSQLGMRHYAVTAFGPILKVSRGNPRGWMVSASASPQSYVGSNDIDLEPGFEMLFEATKFESESFAYGLRLRIVSVRASEPKFTHEHSSYSLELGLSLF